MIEAYCEIHNAKTKVKRIIIRRVTTTSGARFIFSCGHTLDFIDSASSMIRIRNTDVEDTSSR